MAKITIAAISKAFGDTLVLDNVNLAISDGEFLTLVGPSGCGKSTLLRIIAGLENQDDGSIHIDEHKVDDTAPKDRDLAMVFQSYALYPHLTAAENMAVPLRMRRQTWQQRLPILGALYPGTQAIRQSIDQDVVNAARMLGIEELLHRKPGQLSGGQRQRVALGRAMVRKPVGFLMDEPLSNLDASLRLRMRAELVELHRQLGTTFIYVTHDQAEAMTMSDRIAVMRGGKILQCASPTEIYNNPADMRIAEFIGAPKINLLPVEPIENGTLCLFGHGLGLTLDDPAASRHGDVLHLGVRPEALEITSSDGPVRGTLRLIENLGAEAFAHLDVRGITERVVIRLDPRTGNNLVVGQPLSMTFDPAVALLFAAGGERLRTHLPLPARKELAGSV